MIGFMVDFITPQMRAYFSKCELEYLDEDECVSLIEEGIIDKAIDILTEHLENGTYECYEDEELECLQLALTVVENCNRRRRGFVC